MQQIGIQLADGAIDRDRFMHKFADPFSFRLDRISRLSGPDTIRMQDPASQVLRHARNGIPVEAGPVFLICQISASSASLETLISVEGKIQSVTQALPQYSFAPHNHARKLLPRARPAYCDLDGAIVRAAIQHQNFVAAAQTLNHPRHVAFFVKVIMVAEIFMGEAVTRSRRNDGKR